MTQIVQQELLMRLLWEPKFLATRQNLARLGKNLPECEKVHRGSGLERERDKLPLSLPKHLDPALPEAIGDPWHSQVFRYMRKKVTSSALAIISRCFYHFILKESEPIFSFPFNPLKFLSQDSRDPLSLQALG